MKIVTVIDILEGGGKERRLIELFKGFDRVGGIQSNLIVLSDRIGYDEINKVNTRVHIVERKSPKDPTVFIRLYEIFKSLSPDIVQCWDLLSASFAIMPAKLLALKFVNASISHAPNRIKPFSKNWVRSKLTFAISDAIVANSKAGLMSYGVTSEKAIFIHNGFDTNRIERLKPENIVREELQIETPNVVGMVGAFRNKKDYETFFGAARIILDNRDDVTFIGLGGGEKLSHYQKIHEKYGNRVLLPGRVKDVESIVNTFNIGVLSTFTEGISNAIMEYMALAKPVVATDGGGTKELMVDGKTGFLVALKSVPDLAERIQQLLNNPTKSKEMGRAGRERILAEFNLEKMTRGYLKLYRDLSRS